MKPTIIVAALAPAVASAQWWGGAPSCAQYCLSSAFNDNSTSSTASADWPSQTDYCNSNGQSNLGSCLSSSCSATPTAWSSYSSLSSSLCSQWASCTSAGSTGTQTITIPSGSVTWGAPGGWPTGGGGSGPWNNNNGGGGPGGHGGSGGNGWGWGGDDDDNGGYSLWSQWASAYSGSRTWTGGVITVTGCVGSGSPWYAGPGGGWNANGGFDGWVGWGSGWTQGPTSTATVTYTTTVSGSGGGGGATTTVVTGLATVAAAVSGGLTTTQTLGTPAPVTATPNAAPGGGLGMRGGVGGEGSIVTVMLGLALGSVVGVALML